MSAQTILGVFRGMMIQDTDDARVPALYLTTMHMIPYVNTKAGSAIGGFGHERWVDGRRPTALSRARDTRPERVNGFNLYRC